MLTGRTLGPYRVGEKLGAGGMAEVYQARDSRLNRLVALKVLTGESATPIGCSASSRKRAPRRRSTIRTS